jgi:hypothetical protein
MFTGLRLRAMSTLLDQICNQLRARLETVADELVHVSPGQGAFSDPSGVDMNMWAAPQERPWELRTSMVNAISPGNDVANRHIKLYLNRNGTSWQATAGWYCGQKIAAKHRRAEKISRQGPNIVAMLSWSC